MPLLRKKPFVCETPPAHLTANDLVFYCKFTGEAFTDYELVILGVTLCYFISFAFEPRGFLISRYYCEKKYVLR